MFKVPGQRERILMVPAEGEQGHADSQRTDEQSSIDQAEMLRVIGTSNQRLLDGIVDCMLNGRSVPFVDLDHLQRK